MHNAGGAHGLSSFPSASLSDTLDDYAHIAEFYDSVPLYAVRSDVAFYVEQAVTSAGPVLELGCGTGRVLIPIARKGITVTGIDISRTMLRTCTSRLRLEDEATRSCTTLLWGDMRNFHLRRGFALVTIPFGSFQRLLTMQDQVDCLAAIRHHLRPKGRLVFDLFNLPLQIFKKDNIGKESNSERTFHTPDGRTISRGNRIVSHDPLSQVTQREIIYYVTHPNGHAERLVHSFGFMRTLRDEAEQLLAKSGFEVENLYTDFEKTPAGPMPRSVLVVQARRQ